MLYMSFSKTKTGTSHEPQIKQLKRIEGQVRGLTKMIEEKRYCIDILTQIKAVRSSLASVENKILNEHLNHCVYRAIDSKNKKDGAIVLEEIRELLNVRKQ